MATISEQPIYDEAAERRADKGLVAVLILGGLLVAGGFGYAAHVNAVEEAKQAGREQVVSAIGGLYAGCVVEHSVRLTQNGKRVDDCEALYDTYNNVYDAFAVRTKR